MKIYIRSAGAHPDQGYDWWRLPDPLSDNQRLIREKPGFTGGFDLSWFDDDQISVLLRYYEKQLHLLVTGLPSKGRTDFAGRLLRNDMAFSVVDNSEEEKKLRKLTAAFIKLKPPSAMKPPDDFLQSHKFIIEEIDACIRPNSSTEHSGFKVDMPRLLNVLKEAVNFVKKTASQSGVSSIKLNTFQVARDSVERRQDIIAWLMSEDPLPNHLEGRQVIVLVSPYPGLLNGSSENSQYHHQLKSRYKEVWCQLTTLVDWENWRSIEPKIFEKAIEKAKNNIEPVSKPILDFGIKLIHKVIGKDRNEL